MTAVPSRRLTPKPASLSDCVATSPLVQSEWEKELKAAQVEQSVVQEILDGIAHGVRLRFEGKRGSLQAPEKRFDADKTEAIRKDLERELLLGRLAGPFTVAPLPNLRISPLGAVRKKGPVVAWRRTHDLSWPRRQEDSSVNDGMLDFNTTYTSIDEAAALICDVGRGAWMGKIDLKDAYRHLTIHREDIELLGMRFQGFIYIDLCLPFGARSAPAIFNFFADALVRFAKHHGTRLLIHFLDDFFFIGESFQEVDEAMKRFLSMCSRLGVSVNHQKTEGPAQRLKFLGLIVDALKMRLEVEPSRLAEILASLRQWVEKTHCSRVELQSLVGLLNFVSRAIHASRSFLRRLISALHSPSRRIVLSEDMREDLKWWLAFASQWNGVSLITLPQIILSEHLDLYTDASGHTAAAFFRGEWFQHPFSLEQLEWSIDAKELFAVVLAAFTFGLKWKGLSIVLRSDNMGACAAVNSLVSSSPTTMTLIRKLLFASACFAFDLRAVHIPGALNTVADALSRYNMLLFSQLRPRANRHPTPVAHPPGHAW